MKHCFIGSSLYHNTIYIYCNGLRILTIEEIFYYLEHADRPCIVTIGKHHRRILEAD